MLYLCLSAMDLEEGCVKGAVVRQLAKAAAAGTASLQWRMANQHVHAVL